MGEKKQRVVGIISKNPDEIFSKKKSAAAPEKHFRACCQVWIEVYGLVVPAPPGEEVADPNIWKDKVEMRHLKFLLKDLRERAEQREIVWDEETATKRFRAFVMRAGDDDFLSKNFLLRIISSFKVKIFNNQITPKKDGSEKSKRVGTGAPQVGIKSKGSFGKL